MSDIATTTPPPVTLGDLLRVVSKDTKPHKLLWDSRQYVITSEKPTHVPFEVVKLYFGDPRSSDKIASYQDIHGVTHWVPDRASEIRRLRCLYDNQLGDENTVTKHPNVEVYDYDGNRVLTVLDDPEGRSTSQARLTVQDNDEMMHLIRRQQQQIDILMQRLQVTGDDIEPEEAADELETGEQDAADTADPFTTTDELPQDG